jgi:hypothetical protein
MLLALSDGDRRALQVEDLAAPVKSTNTITIYNSQLFDAISGNRLRLFWCTI